MIRAVCFDRKLLTMEGLQSICRRMNGTVGGYLVDGALVNCIESFPDGTVWLSRCHRRERGITDCRSDAAMFVHVNSYASPVAEGGMR